MKSPLLLPLLLPVVWCSLRAVGNVAIVARSTSLIHTPAAPAFIQATHLICGAEKLGESLAIRGAEFSREGSTRAPFTAKVEGKKAVLEIGKAPLRSAGKYKCEVITASDESVTGNLVVYLNPVFEFDHDVDQEHTPEPHTVLLKKRTVKSGADLSLNCSTFGYPEPFVRWEKDGQPLEGDVEYDGHSVLIKSVSSSGVYSCHSENSYPLFVGGPSMPHQTTLKIPVHVE